MNSFWETALGFADGKEDNAFTKDFGIIPDGTKAFARIEDFSITDKPANDYKEAQRFYEIKWGITQGDFVGRNVFQKIKCFDADEKIRFKALNMLRLILNLANVAPSAGAPDTAFLKQLVGRVMGIKIKEWSWVKDDGGMLEGNFISEVHLSSGFEPMVGKKMEVVQVVQAAKAAPAMLSEDTAF